MKNTHSRGLPVIYYIPLRKQQGSPSNTFILYTPPYTAGVSQQGGGVRQQNERLIGEAALFTPGRECSCPVVPLDFNRLIRGHRLNTALLRPLYMGGPLPVLLLVFRVVFLVVVIFCFR